MTGPPPARRSGPADRERPRPDAQRPVESEVPHASPARPAGSDPVVARTTHPRARSGSSPLEAVAPVTAARRLRSALGVVLLVVAVGLSLAAAIGVLAVAISRALEGAVS